MDILEALKEEETQLLKNLKTIRRVRRRVIQEYKTSGGKRNEMTVVASKKPKPS
jgi:hypothetical protein